jgi:iron complex outermembrane receptor protein
VSVGEIPQNGPYVSRPEDLQRARTIGLFGGVDYDFTDALTGSLELRHQWDEVFLDPNVRAAQRRSIEDTFKSTTPRVSLTYQFTPNQMVYASYAQGVRPGGFNGALLARPQSIIDILEQQYGVQLEIEEEKLQMYELGLKGRFLENRLQTTLALYKGKLTNQQISQSIFVNTPQLVTTITFTNNAGRTDLQGIELEGSLEATDRLRFDGSYGYYDTEIVADNCAQCVRIGGTLTSSHGNRVDATPIASGSLSATYTVPVRGDVSWYGRAEYVYTGKSYGDRLNLSYLDAAHRGNLRSGLETDAFRIEAFLLNAFDDDTPVNAQLNTDLPSFGTALKIGLPDRRQWGLRGSYRF